MFKRPPSKALDAGEAIVVSTSFTPFFKFVLPLFCWSFGACLLVAGLVVGGVTAEYYVAVVSWLCVTSIINWWNNIPLKEVTVYRGSLHVSNFRREVEIPLSLVQAVAKTGRPTLWWRWPPLRVVITLRSTTLFGSEIMFIPGYYVDDVLRDLSRARHSRKVTEDANVPPQTLGEPE